MQRPASELFAPLDEYYPRRVDYRNTAHHAAALESWETYGDPKDLLKGMTQKAQRRFLESRLTAGAFPAGQLSLVAERQMQPGGGAFQSRGRPTEGSTVAGRVSRSSHRSRSAAPGTHKDSTASPFAGFDLYGGAVSVLLALLLAVPAFAQDSGMSDELLRAELEEYSSRNYPNQKLRGYRGRVTSPDYYVEQQMQQLDEQRFADDRARADRLLQEQGRRALAREQAERQARQDAYYQSARESRATIDRYHAEQRQKSEQAYQQRMQQYERDRQAWQAEQKARSAQVDQEWERRFARTRAETQRQAERAQYVAPIRPDSGSGPAITGPYFPPLQQRPRNDRTPLEAFQEGQQLGNAIANIFKGPERKRARERKDAILKKHINGAATREDYAQLIDDGYSGLALELFKESDYYPD